MISLNNPSSIQERQLFNESMDELMSQIPTFSFKHLIRDWLVENVGLLRIDSTNFIDGDCMKPATEIDVNNACSAIKMFQAEVSELVFDLSDIVAMADDMERNLSKIYEDK